MAGDNRKRFCDDCKLHVYNLSGMTTYDAENLLRLSEGRLCVRYFQRADGTVLTQECPVGWARVKRRLSMATAAVFGLLISFVGLFGSMSMFGRKNVVMGEMIPYATPTPNRQPLMGAVAMPSPTPRVSPSPKDQPLMGKPMINEELRQKVLKQAGA